MEMRRFQLRMVSFLQEMPEKELKMMKNLQVIRRYQLEMTYFRPENGRLLMELGDIKTEATANPILLTNGYVKLRR